MFKLFGRSEKPAPRPSPTSPTPSLAGALSVTGKSLIGRLLSLGRRDNAPLTEDDLEEMEETLIRADVGVDLAVEITEQVRRTPHLHAATQLRPFLRETFLTMLHVEGASHVLRLDPTRLNVYLVVGVNGAGKTTLIGKLAHRFVRQGLSVVIGAGDTFRAAAEDQLAIWAERAGATLVRKDKGDPAAVVFETLQTARTEGAQVVIIDTAGRLQNKFNLMEELQKIQKILDRTLPPDAVFESLLVLDATTGQNALQQARVFHQAAPLTGIAVTKLDGSAKGGIVFQIARQLQVPVKLIGLGEGLADLADFDPAAFVDALFETSPEGASHV